MGRLDMGLSFSRRQNRGKTQIRRLRVNSRSREDPVMRIATPRTNKPYWYLAPHCDPSALVLTPDLPVEHEWLSWATNISKPPSSRTRRSSTVGSGSGTGNSNWATPSPSPWRVGG
jgi:hypothetical protein